VNGPGPSCGRAMFSDLHASGNPSSTDSVNMPGGSPPPGGCGANNLTPQELALEFALFDLAACVTPDSAPPATTLP
jgi:hypothetical protein